MEAKAIRMLLVIFLRTIAATALIGTAVICFLKTDLGKLIFKV
jgi:hypothetical protein